MWVTKISQQLSILERLYLNSGDETSEEVLIVSIELTQLVISQSIVEYKRERLLSVPSYFTLYTQFYTHTKGGV